MPWITDLHITDVDGSGGEYELEAPLVYMDRQGEEWITPTGSRSDFSSFPSFVRFFLPVTVLAKAPWLHDDLYRRQPGGVTRKKADHLYRDSAYEEFNEADEPPLSRAQIRVLYYGLRVGGWATWNSYKKALK